MSSRSRVEVARQLIFDISVVGGTMSLLMRAFAPGGCLCVAWIWITDASAVACALARDTLDANGACFFVVFAAVIACIGVRATDRNGILLGSRFVCGGSCVFSFRLLRSPVLAR